MAGRKIVVIELPCVIREQPPRKGALAALEEAAKVNPLSIGDIYCVILPLRCVGHFGRIHSIGVANVL